MPIANSLFSQSESQLWKEQIQARIKLRDINCEHWVKSDLFSLVWWLMLILFVSLWFIWWKRVDKTRIHEIVTYGLMVTLFATVVDIVGAEFVLWGYPNKLLPLVPPLLITDFCILPIVYMLLYQRFNNWKAFIISTLIVSFVIAFVAEPIAVLLGIYQMNNWNHLYSFPMYIFLALLIKWVINKIMKIQKNSSY